MNLLNSFSFILPTRIEYGVGATIRLVDIIKALNAESILVVTDKGIRAPESPIKALCVQDCWSVLPVRLDTA